MKKRQRRQAAPVESHSPIDRAIDSAAEKARPGAVTLLIHRDPIRLAADARLAVKQGPAANDPQLLARGSDGVWRGVLMPAGSTFELRPSGPAADIWTPR